MHETFSDHPQNVGIDHVSLLDILVKITEAGNEKFIARYAFRDEEELFAFLRKELRFNMKKPEGGS